MIIICLFYKSIGGNGDKCVPVIEEGTYQDRRQTQQYHTTYPLLLNLWSFCVQLAFMDVWGSVPLCTVASASFLLRHLPQIVSSKLDGRSWLWTRTDIGTVPNFSSWSLLWSWGKPTFKFSYAEEDDTLCLVFIDGGWEGLYRGIKRCMAAEVHAQTRKAVEDRLRAIF